MSLSYKRRKDAIKRSRKAFRTALLIRFTPYEVDRMFEAAFAELLKNELQPLWKEEYAV